MMNGIYLIIITVLILAYLLWATIYITTKYLIPKNENKLMELKNEKYNLFASVNTESVNVNITEYFTNHIQKYIAYKFISRKINYIREEDVETMIKDITKLIYIEISELYIFYIKMLYSINNDDDLLKYINLKVKEISIELITNYNSSMQL